MTAIIGKLHPSFVMFHNRWDPERPAWNAFFQSAEGQKLDTTFLEQRPGVSIDL
jgi:hypothetical protein